MIQYVGDKMQPNVLVTGACGFIGSNVADRLHKDGYNVTGYDDLSFGVIENLNKDIRLIDNFHELEEFLITHVPEYIIVLHAKSSVYMVDDDPISAFEVNVGDFIKIMEYAKTHQVKKVIYASTSSLYNNSPKPSKEYHTVEPGSFYELYKYMREQIADLYYNRYGVKSTGMRYFACYGPNETHKKKHANMISQFIWAIKKGEPIEIYGDGNQTRDFTHVDDIVNGTILAMETDYQGVVNIGTDIETTFNDVIEIIEQNLGKKARVKYILNPLKGYVTRTLADITLAQDMLYYEPTISVEKGIKRQVEYYAMH